MKLHQRHDTFTINGKLIANHHKDLNLNCDYNVTNKNPIMVEHDPNCRFCKHKLQEMEILAELKTMAQSCGYEDFYTTNEDQTGFSWLSHNSRGNFRKQREDIEGYQWWMDYPSTTQHIGEFIVHDISFNTYYHTKTKDQIKKLLTPQDSGCEDLKDWLNVND